MHPGKHEDEGFPGCILQYFTRLTSNNYGDFSGQPQPALDAPDRNNPAWARMGSDIPQELNDTQSFANPILNVHTTSIIERVQRIPRADYSWTTRLLQKTVGFTCRSALALSLLSSHEAGIAPEYVQSNDCLFFSSFETNVRLAAINVTRGLSPGLPLRICSGLLCWC